MQGHAVAGAPLWMSVCLLKCKGALHLLMATGCSRLPSICRVPRQESDWHVECSKCQHCAMVWCGVSCA